MAHWAVFDVDGTLLPGKSMEYRFLLHKIKKLEIPFLNYLRYFFHALIKWARKDKMEAFINNKYYLKGLREDKTWDEGRKFVKEMIIPMISEKGLEKIKKYRANGYKILVMSGSPDYLTVPLGDFLKPTFLISCKLKTSKGHYTGEADGLHPFGERKTQLLKGVAKDLELDFKSSAAFGNHHCDAHHLSLFGEAVAVNPTKDLGKIAEEKGWDIEYWE
ncbi:haloacid dehalogenase-like hydrolase [bacterium]|nr:haloacid dehalogenase-like hydrolase [bacterium]